MKVKVSVEYKDCGKNITISGEKEDIVKCISDVIDDNVTRIIIKKEPTHKVPEEKLRG